MMPFNVMEKSDPPEPSTGKRDSRVHLSDEGEAFNILRPQGPHTMRRTAALSREPSGGHI